jgi:hypothetical protein
VEGRSVLLVADPYEDHGRRDLQMAFAIITAWADRENPPNVELINSVVQAYIDETSPSDVISGLISLGGLLAVEYSKISPTHETAQEVLAALATFYAASAGDE